MPNIKSAKKRVLVNAKKNAQNVSKQSELKTALKKINAAIDINNMEEAERLLPEVYSALDKAVIKGLIHKNAAANKKSGIAKRIADIKSGKKEVVIKKDNKTIAAEKAKAAQAAREAARQEKKAAQEAAKAAKLAEEEAKKAEKKTAKKTTKKADDAEKKPAKKTTKKAEGEATEKPKKTTKKKADAE